jgi:hypothetical protein
VQNKIREIRLSKLKIILHDSLSVENKRFIFVVKKRDDQHQNSQRNENDGFGDRIEIGDVVKEKLRQSQRKKRDRADPEVFFVLVNSQNDQTQRVDAPQNAQAQFVRIAVTENVHQIYQLAAHNQPERQKEHDVKSEINRRLRKSFEQKFLLNISITGKQQRGAEEVGKIPDENMKRAVRKILRFRDAQVALAQFRKKKQSDGHENEQRENIQEKIGVTQ